jgi:hypothetical protein
MRFPSKKFYGNFMSMKMLRYLVVDRVEQDNDNPILISGGRGIGKSTFFIKFASGFENIEQLERDCNKHLIEGQKPFKLEGYTPFSMGRDIVYTVDELEKCCMENKKAIVGADEAVVSLSRRNSMTKINKQLHRTLTINRKNNNTIFLLIPNIEDVDVQILQYCSMWIHIDSRGLAVIFLPNNSGIFGKKRWDLDNARKIHDKIREDNPNIIKVPYWIYSNFRGYVKFGKLSKEREERYLKLADEKKNLESEKNQELGEKTPRMNTEKQHIIKDIAQKLINGEISTTDEYYANCAVLQFKKDKLNRAVNDELLMRGEGKSAAKFLFTNKAAIKTKKTKDNFGVNASNLSM